MPSNILEWHYVVKGPENTPYDGGFYHGKLIFPKEFPFRPPRILMITPNGRFKTNTRLCLSISDFHPDTWNPAWSVSTILTGLLSFMVETSPTLGSIETNDYQRKQLAISSGEFNLRDAIFCELFPEICEEIQSRRSKDESKGLGESERSDITAASAAQGEGDGMIGSTIANIVVIFGFAAFAYTVKCVIRAVGSN